MAGGVASPSERALHLPDRQAGWTDELWAAVVGPIDALLRTCYGIREFTDDPDCLFRIALDRAREPVTLSDRTQIDRGRTVGALHLWNEHLRRYSARGPDLGWACDMRQRIRHSLRLLTDHIERDSASCPVQAFRVDTTWSSRRGSGQIRRVAARYGFEVVEHSPSMLRQVRALGESVHAWALTRAFNPSALPRQPFLRDHHELWISRSTLLHIYGRGARPPRGWPANFAATADEAPRRARL